MYIRFGTCMITNYGQPMPQNSIQQSTQKIYKEYVQRISISLGRVGITIDGDVHRCLTFKAQPWQHATSRPRQKH